MLKNLHNNSSEFYQGQVCDNKLTHSRSVNCNAHIPTCKLLLSKDNNDTFSKNDPKIAHAHVMQNIKNLAEKCDMPSVNIENVNIINKDCKCDRTDSLTNSKTNLSDSNSLNNDSHNSNSHILATHNSFVPRNILVKLKSFDRKLYAFLDSGSEINLVKKQVADMLIRNFNLKVHKPDLNAESINNNPIALHGIINIPFKFGRRTIYHRFYIAENVGFTGALLLGIDFLNKADATIKCGNDAKVILHDIIYAYKSKDISHKFASIKVVDVSKAKPKNFIHNVKVSRHTIIPPNTMCLIKVSIDNFNRSAKDTFLIDNEVPSEDEIPLIKIARSIVKPNKKGNCLVQCVNVSDTHVKLKNDSLVANAKSVDLVEDRTPDLAPKEIIDQIHNLDLSHLSHTAKDDLISVLLNHSKAFSTKDEPIGHITNIVHELNTPPGAVSYIPQYRLAKTSQDAVQEQIKDLLKFKIIKECTSPFNSPILMIRKPDKTFRMCVDMRGINKLTEFKPFPLPRIDETLQQLQGKQFFSTLDAKSGYYHIDLKESDMHKTAFRTKDNCYCFTKLPFGLKNASFTYQQSINKILMSALGNFSLVYIDDVIIFSDTYQQHLDDLSKVFKLLIDGGVKLAIKKCKFAQKSIKFLGFIVSGEGVSPDQAKVDAFLKFPRPTNVKSLQQFIASVNFYRALIPGFAYLSAPLTSLLKKDAPFIWNKEHEFSFQKLRTALCDSPILKHPDFTKKFEVHCDSSSQAIGAVLMQREDPNNPKSDLYPVAYFSRKLTDCESRWTVSEWEALAIVAAIRHFHYFLYGNEFIVVTDHLPLKRIFGDIRSKNPRIQRWALFLQDYQFECFYKSGLENVLPDALSRNCTQESNAALRAIKIKNKNKYSHLKHLPDDLSFDNLLQLKTVKSEQLKEHRWKDIIDYLKGGTVTSPPPRTLLEEFCLVDDILYYSSNLTENKLRLVIPKKLVNEALYYGHNTKVHIHPGFQRTLYSLRKLFYWPNMSSDIKVYCATCVACQKRKPGIRPRAALGEFDTVSMPMERIGIDLIGKFNQTSSNNKWVLCIVDHFSRYTELYPIPSKSAKDVQLAFQRFLFTHGAVQSVVSDRGKEFLNNSLGSLLRQFHIKICPTSGYRPQCNGMIENRNNQIKNAFSFLSSKRKTDWDEFAPMVQASINSSYHSSINNTPYYVHTGRDFILPIQNAFKGLDSFDPHRDADYIPNLLYALNQSYEIAKNTSKRAQDRRKIRYDSNKVRLSEAKPGDLVLITNETRSGAETRSFSDRYIGPYRVLQKYNNRNLLIQDLNNLANKKIIHVDRSKLLHTLPNHEYPNFVPPSSIDSTNGNKTVPSKAKDEQSKTATKQPVKQKKQVRFLIDNKIEYIQKSTERENSHVPALHRQREHVANINNIAQCNSLQQNHNRPKPDFTKILSFLKNKLKSQSAF